MDNEEHNSNMNQNDCFNSEISNRVENIEKKIKTVEDSELFKIYLISKSEELFKYSRNKLALWLSPIAIALLILGYNIYDSNKKITEAREVASKGLKESEFFFSDTSRVKILKMLVANFYQVSSIRIPLGITIFEKSYKYPINSSSIYNLRATFLKDTTESRHVEALIGFAEINAPNYSKEIVGFNLENFYPNKQIDILRLKEYKYLELDFEIHLKEDLNQKEIDSLYLYTYTGYTHNSMINGVTIYPKNDEQLQNYLSEPRYIFKKGTYQSEINTIDCWIRYDISELFKNLDKEYEDKHLGFSNNSTQHLDHNTAFGLCYERC